MTTSNQAIAAQSSELFTHIFAALPMLLSNGWIRIPDPVISRKHLRKNSLNEHKTQMTGTVTQPLIQMVLRESEY